MQPGAPEDADPNDVRWLSVQRAPSSDRTPPVPTAIPAGDYPLPFYTRVANGRIPRLPNPPFSFPWTGSGQAGGAYTSPPAVGGNSVLLGSADEHLYSFERLNGNQRWRNQLGSVIRVSPIFYDGEFFVVDETGLMRAFEDHGNEAGEIWNAPAGKPPLTSFNVYSDTLFLAVGQGADHQLLAIDRDNGDVLDSFSVSGPGLRYPVIGEQLVYVADSLLWALDVFTLDPIWQRSDLPNPEAGPIYVSPGVQGAAELYVVTENHRIFCLDANTGDEIWNFDNEEEATALGLTDTALLVAGTGYIKAISRESVTELWRVPIAGAIRGIPMSDSSRIMVLTQSGSLTYLDAANRQHADDGQHPRGRGGGGSHQRFVDLYSRRGWHPICGAGCAMSKADGVRMTPSPKSAAAAVRPGWDALLLVLLTVATLQVRGFAEAAALPTRVADVARHPWLGGLLSPAGLAAFDGAGPAPGDAIGLLLNALTLGGLLVYLVADLLPWAQVGRRLKWAALMAVLLTALVLPTVELILLRDQSGPASYTHDGGVIQTEATVAYFLAGKNPYVEDYVDTPMAEWGFSEYRTALYHYPYLPWTFVFSAPFYLAGQALGFYDQRIVYLLLMLVALALAAKLAQGARARLALVAVLGLNPVMNLDIVFGQNDSFVLCWLVFSLVAWLAWRRRMARTDTTGAVGTMLAISTVCYGLACASKPTAWFFAPFYGLLLVADVTGGRLDWPRLRQTVGTMVRRGWPALAAFVLLVGPYVVWNAGALYDDVWRWSNGQGETGYQIWGWGASNFVLALGWVTDRFDQWPFIILELVLALPLLGWFVVRQWRANTVANACWHYGLLLLAFFYGSRFLNENYLGYILALLAIGVLSAGRAPVEDDPAPI